MRLPGNFNRTPKVIYSARESASKSEPGKVGARKCCGCRSVSTKGGDLCEQCMNDLRDQCEKEFSRGRQ